MITVNGKPMEWREGLSFAEILQNLGYTISRPRVILRVDGDTIPKEERDSFIFLDGMDVRIINTLCGG